MTHYRIDRETAGQWQAVETCPTCFDAGERARALQQMGTTCRVVRVSECVVDVLYPEPAPVNYGGNRRELL